MAVGSQLFLAADDGRARRGAPDTACWVSGRSVPPTGWQSKAKPHTNPTGQLREPSRLSGGARGTQLCPLLRP